MLRKQTKSYRYQLPMLSSISKATLLIVILLSSTSHSFIVDQTHTVYQGGDTMTEYISAQPQIGTKASEYFLCGISFQSMKWQKTLYNCNCGKNAAAVWQCEWCPNYFFSMHNAIKATFCKGNDWAKQLQRTFQTGNTQSGSWTEIKCSRNQYASRVAIKLNYEQNDVYVGFNALQIKCQNVNFTESYIIQNNNWSGAADLSRNKQGTFVSALKIQYINSGKLTGAVFAFETMPSFFKDTSKILSGNLPLAELNIGATRVTFASVSELYQNLAQNYAAAQTPYKLAFTSGLMKWRASTIWDCATCKTYQINGTGSWVAQFKDPNQWVQGYSDTKMKIIGVLTQGHYYGPQWITNFQITYSNDGIQYYSLFNRRIFVANYDQHTIIENRFDPPIQARFLRLHAGGYNNHPSTRVQILVQSSSSAATSSAK